MATTNDEAVGRLLRQPIPIVERSGKQMTRGAAGRTPGREATIAMSGADIPATEVGATHINLPRQMVEQEDLKAAIMETTIADSEAVEPMAADKPGTAGPTSTTAASKQARLPPTGLPGAAAGLQRSSQSRVSRATMRRTSEGPLEATSGRLRLGAE